MKKTLILLLLALSSYLIITYGINLYESLTQVPTVTALPPPPPMSMEAGPIKVVIDEDTPWESIAKLISTILATYLGVKVINKYIK